MTSSSRITLQPAFVIHHRPYRDSSLLVELFTRDHGRIGLVARGVKKSRSRSTAALQPFRPLQVSWSGRGELGTLTSIEETGSEDWLQGNFLISGLYVNELLQRLLHRHDPHPALFTAYQNVLSGLSNAQTMSLLCQEMDASHQAAERTLIEQNALRIFEKYLLQELGYGLVLDHDVTTSRPLADDTLYRYILGKGPVQISNEVNRESIPDESAITQNYQRRENEVTVHGHSLLSLARDRIVDELALREVKSLMRLALRPYLGFKPLYSRKLYQGVTSPVAKDIVDQNDPRLCVGDR